MRRAAGLVVFAVGLVAPATLAADSPAPDLAAEIAWARAQWPDELRGVRFQIPLARLLDWVPPGRTVTAFVHSPSHACLPVELSHARDALLEARIVTRRWVEGGRQRRELTVAWVGAEFVWEDSDDEIEVRAADGTWHMESSSGYGTETDLGALSSVEGGVARFDGYALRLSPYCDGPVEGLPCTAGGEHPCERCDAVGLMVAGPRSLGGRSRHHDRPIACQEACPRYPESADLSRLTRLARRVSAWRPDTEARSQNAALYRSRDACLRDHPPASARAKG